MSYFGFEKDLGKMKLHELENKKLERQNSWQYVKHARLYSGQLHALKEKLQ